MTEMQAAIDRMTTEELIVEFERLLKASDRNSEWTRAVRGTLKKRRLVPSESGVVRWK